MPRKPTSVNKDAVNLLRHMIRRKTNLNCDSFSEIQTLRDGIAKLTDSSLSVQTLSRFFGVIRSDFNPSHHTLDTLSRYLSYSSFHHFELLNDSAVVRDDQSVFISEIFDAMFSGLESSNPQSLFVVTHKNLLHWLIKNPQYYNDVYSIVAKRRLGRKMYFQDQVNIDALNKGFGNALHYYLLHSATREEKMYGYTMFCYWYFLNNDKAGFRKYFAFVQQFPDAEIMSFHSNVIDRYYAACTFNQVITNQRDEAAIDYNLPDFDLLTANSLPSNSSTHAIAEALLLTGEFQKTWELLTNLSSSGSEYDHRREIEPEVNIFRLLSGFLSGNISKRRCLSLYLEQLYKPLPPGSEDYGNIFLYMLRYRLFNRPTLRRQVKNTFDSLVEKTGFVYFSTFFEKYIREDGA